MKYPGEKNVHYLLQQYCSFYKQEKILLKKKLEIFQTYCSAIETRKETDGIVKIRDHHIILNSEVGK